MDHYVDSYASLRKNRNTWFPGSLFGFIQKIHGGVCLSRVVLIVLMMYLGAPHVLSQEWPVYGGNPGGQRYSPLEQINKSNVVKLQVAWIYDTGDFSDGTMNRIRSTFEATPLVMDGIMYITTPFSRLIALEAETGKELWQFDPKINKMMRGNLFINRGAAYWSDGKRKRIFLGDMEGRLFAIDILFSLVM